MGGCWEPGGCWCCCAISFSASAAFGAEVGGPLGPLAPGGPPGPWLGIVLDWLAYPHLSDSCRLFTAAPSKRGNAAAHRAIFASREAAGIRSDDLLDPHKGQCPEPTIYFELGCRHKPHNKDKEHHEHGKKQRASAAA